MTTILLLPRLASDHDRPAAPDHLEAAWQLMNEDKIGSLEVGKYADMVILDKDPRKVEPTEISDIKILETWLNGKRVYKRGE